MSRATVRRALEVFYDVVGAENDADAEARIGRAFSETTLFGGWVRFTGSGFVLEVNGTPDNDPPDHEVEFVDDGHSVAQIAAWVFEQHERIERDAEAAWERADLAEEVAL